MIACHYEQNLVFPNLHTAWTAACLGECEAVWIHCDIISNSAALKSISV